MHGTVFSGRDRHLDEMGPGDAVDLRPCPPVEASPEVWVHLPSGDLIGHLPPEIGAWLAPWIRAGGSVSARAVRVSGDEVPSWRRVLIEVECD